jgi:uncharacterized membrane protein YeaQ/YmgE (transglycosylase-associated protein family)
MAVLFWVTLGLLAGAIAKLVVWDTEQSHWSAVLALAVAGAVVGGRIAGMLFPNSDSPGFDPATIFLALAGAAVLLAPYGIVVARRRAATTVEFEQPRRAA